MAFSRAKERRRQVEAVRCEKSLAPWQNNSAGKNEAGRKRPKGWNHGGGLLSSLQELRGWKFFYGKNCGLSHAAQLRKSKYFRKLACPGGYGRHMEKRR